MFREIRTKERITDRVEEKKKAYQEIKPKTDITDEEANDFWKSMMQNFNNED